MFIPPARPLLRSPRRLVLLGPLLLGGLFLWGAREQVREALATPVAKGAPAKAKLIDPPPEPVSAALLAEPTFCGWELPAAAVERPLPCQIPALPCGPVPANKIGAAGVDTNEDLDGDGQPDAVLAGVRIGAGAYAYGVIYRFTPLGLVLSDFQRVELPADPAVAAVAQAMPRGAPILRDGHDLPLRDGRTLSIARLRRFDGQQFRTLLTVCAHRQEPAQGERPAREAHNRITFPDVDRDGTPEVVVGGALRPVVFRVAGAALREDPALTQRYREDAPEEKKARALRTEAERYYQQGEWRRAAAALRQARDLSPHNGELRERLAVVLQRVGDPAEVLVQLREAVALAPERTSALCALAEALQKADDDDELAVLRRCVQGGPEASRRAAFEARLKALEEEERAAAAAAASADGGVRDGGRGP